MFIKYFFILLNKFALGFKKEMFILFIMSAIGGMLELIGIALIFPVMIVLTSSDNLGGKKIIEFMSLIFPSLSDSLIALLLALIMIFVFLFKNIFMMILIDKQNDFARKITDMINKNVINKLLFAPYRQYETINYGDKETLLTSTISDICLNFILRSVILFANALVALFIILLLFYKFTVPSILSLAFIILYAYLENKYFKFKAKILGHEGVELIKDYSKDVNFVIKSQKEILISNKQEYFSNYLLKNSKEISKNFSKRITYGNWPLYVTEIGVIFAFLIMILSILLCDDVSKASIISSLAAIALIVLRLVPQLNKVLISMYEINISKPKVIWFLDIYDKISKFGYEEFKNLPKIDFKDKIILQDASFEYEENKGIFDINLEIKKGEFIGIIGFSGAGKTTLINILSGIYPLKTGKLSVDDVEITRENLSSWQKNISFLPQEAVFLNDTVLKNVAFGLNDDEIDVEKAKRALKMAGLYDIDINAKLELSTGQKQRVALARVYYRDFEVLILDEATSSLDSESEKIVSENISSMKGKKTIIAIAHRIQTLNNCDRIIYIKDGKISDTGDLSYMLNKYFN